MNARTRIRQSFTLIELLVVVAIIAILAALLLPALQAARWKTKETLCATNLKNLGTAMVLYADEMDEFLPPYDADIFNSAMAGVTGKGYLDVLWGKLTRYGLQGVLAQCPLGRGPTWNQYWMKSASSRSDYFYTLNGGPYYTQSLYQPMRLSGINQGQFSKTINPAAILLVCDTATDPWDASGSYANIHKHSPTGPAASQNMLYLDGHVSLIQAPRYNKAFGLGY